MSDRSSELLLVVCVAIASLLSGGCDEQTPGAPTPAATVILAVGQTAAVPGTPLSLRFIAVTNDSRCPSDVVCIQAGSALSSLEASTGSGSSRVELSTADVARVAQVGDYRIELTSLVPYPSVSHPIDPADYRVTLQVGAR